MSRDILYQNDTLQTITAPILHPDGSPQDLTGLRVKFALRGEYDAANLFGPNDGSVTNNTTGEVAYQVSSADLLGASPGVYRGQWILIDNNQNSVHVDAGQFEVRSSL